MKKIFSSPVIVALILTIAFIVGTDLSYRTGYDAGLADSDCTSLADLFRGK